MSADEALGRQFTQRRAAQLAEQGHSLMRGAPQPADIERTGPTGLIQGGKAFDALLDKVPSFDAEFDAAKLKDEYERLASRSQAMRDAKTAQATGGGRDRRLDTCVACHQVVPAEKSKRGKCWGFTREHYTPRDRLGVVPGGKKER